ncbi:MAG: porin family protein [Alphaproteobacteria bacterium]|nr:porin family protein [Alphaproteobacteria bacterium]
MKKILLTSVSVAMATFASNATVRPYVSAHIGYTNANLIVTDRVDHNLQGEWLGDKFAFDVSGAFGIKYDLSKSLALRGELEYDYVEGAKNSEMDDPWWWRSHTVLANAYIDVKTMSVFTPYFSIGAGYQFIHHNNFYINDSTLSALAWQIGCGIAYNVTNTLSVDLGYRYLTSTASVKASGHDFKLHFNNSQFRLGVNYAF